MHSQVDMNKSSVVLYDSTRFECVVYVKHIVRMYLIELLRGGLLSIIYTKLYSLISCYFYLYVHVWVCSISACENFMDASAVYDLHLTVLYLMNMHNQKLSQVQIKLLLSSQYNKSFLLYCRASLCTIATCIQMTEIFTVRYVPLYSYIFYTDLIRTKYKKIY